MELPKCLFRHLGPSRAAMLEGLALAQRVVAFRRPVLAPPLAQYSCFVILAVVVAVVLAVVLTYAVFPSHRKVAHTLPRCDRSGRQCQN